MYIKRKRKNKTSRITTALFIVAKFTCFSGLFRSTLLKYPRAHCVPLFCLRSRSLRTKSHNTRSAVHIWMLFPAAISLRYPPSLPFSFPLFFPFSLMWGCALAIIGNSRGEPCWNSERRARVECIRILLVTRIIVTLLCQRNNGAAEEEQCDKGNCFRGNPPRTGMLPSVIRMSSLFAL